MESTKEGAKCEVCSSPATDACSCGASYCSRACQSQAWNDGHSTVHISGDATQRLLRTLSKPALKFKKKVEVTDLYEGTYEMRGKTYQRRNIEANLLTDACAKLAASFTERIVQKRMGRNKRYPYVKKNDWLLHDRYHSAIYEVAYYWRHVWSLQKHDISKLAFLIENGLEALLALAQPPANTTSVEIFMAIIHSRDLSVQTMHWPIPEDKPLPVLNDFRSSSFNPEVPTDQRLLHIIQHIVVNQPFERRNFRLGLRQIAPAGFNRSRIARAWELLISVSAATLVWAYSDRFRQEDRERTVWGSEIKIRATAIQVYVMDPFINLGVEIMQQALVTLETITPEDVDSEYDSTIASSVLII